MLKSYRFWLGHELIVKIEELFGEEPIEWADEDDFSHKGHTVSNHEAAENFTISTDSFEWIRHSCEAHHHDEDLQMEEGVGQTQLSDWNENWFGEGSIDP